MSSPVRQMASRRLPPLQGAGGSTRLSSNRWRPRIRHNSSDLRRGTHRSHQSQTLQDMFVTDLTPELVTQYLQQNPEFLEHHVTTYVNTEQIERWLQRKTNVGSRAGNRYRLDHHTLNGEVTTEARTSSLSKWKSRIQSSKGRVLQELSKEMNQQHGKLAVLLELSACVSAAVCADGHNLYAVDENKEEISHIFTDTSGQIVQGRTEKMRYRATVASHVAYSKEPLRLKDLAMDRRFPDGLGVGSNRAHSVLALPITDGNCVVLGAVEFYRYSRYSHFTEDEEEVAVYMFLWADMFVAYMEMHNSMTRQRKLNEFLLAVTKSVFQDIVSMDSVIMKIMNYAQKLVSADRASLFLLDHKSRELYARIFDVGSAQGFVSDERQHKEIRCEAFGQTGSKGQRAKAKLLVVDAHLSQDVGALPP